MQCCHLPPCRVHSAGLLSGLSEGSHTVSVVADAGSGASGLRLPWHDELADIAEAARLAGRVAMAPQKFNAADGPYERMRRTILGMEFSLYDFGSTRHRDGGPSWVARTRRVTLTGKDKRKAYFRPVLIFTSVNSTSAPFRKRRPFSLSCRWKSGASKRTQIL